MKTIMEDYQVRKLNAISDFEIKQKINPSHLNKLVNSVSKLFFFGGRRGGKEILKGVFIEILRH